MIASQLIDYNYLFFQEYEPRLQLELYSDYKFKNLAYASAINCNLLVPIELNNV